MTIADEAKKAMTPKTNEKCYKIHGFTKESIPMEYWISDGSYVIVPANEVRIAKLFLSFYITIIKHS